MKGCALGLILKVRVLQLGSGLFYQFQQRYETCLVPRPHYSARPKRFRSRGPNEASMKLRERCAIQIRAHCQYVN